MESGVTKTPRGQLKLFFMKKGKSMKFVPSMLLVFVSLANGCESKSAPAKKKASRRGSPVVLSKSQQKAVNVVRSLGGIVGRPNGSGDVLLVDLSETEVTDTDLVLLKQLPTLTNLRLGKTKVSDAGLVHFTELTNLRMLHLDYTKVSDTGLLNLKELKKLELLQLTGSQVSEAGVRDLEKALPKCKIWWK